MNSEQHPTTEITLKSNEELEARAKEIFVALGDNLDNKYSPAQVESMMDESNQIRDELWVRSGKKLTPTPTDLADMIRHN